MKRNKRSISIVTDEQFQNCINSRSVVKVWIQGEYDKQGIIDTCCDEAVQVGNEYYFRDQCSFFTLQNYFKLQM